jgi:hypothetical protein
VVEVLVGRRQLGEGRGHNKKEAEQAAARDAIERVTELRREAAEVRAGGAPRGDSRREREAPVPEPEAALDPADLEDESGDEVRSEPRRRRRGGRSRSRSEARIAEAGFPSEPEDEAGEAEVVAGEQRRVDPFELEDSIVVGESEPSPRPYDAPGRRVHGREDEDKIESGAERREEGRGAVIEEMERAMEAFGRSSRFGRRRRGR